MALKKLVRDRIPEIIEKKTGEKVYTRILGDEEYRHELRWKLLEEVREACAATDSQVLLEELADLEEVKRAVLHAWNFTHEDLERVREEKLRERGGFEKRLFIIKTEAR